MLSFTEQHGVMDDQLELPRYEDEKIKLMPAELPTSTDSPKLSDTNIKDVAAAADDAEFADSNTHRMIKSLFSLAILLYALMLVAFLTHWCWYGVQFGSLINPDVLSRLELLDLQNRLKERSMEHGEVMKGYLCQVHDALNALDKDLATSATDLGVLTCLVLNRESAGRDGFDGFDEECVIKVETYVHDKLHAAASGPTAHESGDQALLSVVHTLQAMDVEISAYNAFLDDMVERAAVVTARIRLLGRPEPKPNSDSGIAIPGVNTSRIPVSWLEGPFAGRFDATEWVVRYQMERMEEMVKESYAQIISPSKADIQSKISFLAAARDGYEDEKVFSCDYTVKRTVRDDQKGVEVEVVRLGCGVA